jgi:squalene monooxygenase
MFIVLLVGGMTVAFNDVVLLKNYLSHENVPSFAESEVILQKLNEFHWKRKNYCTAINVLAMALYRLFAADDSKALKRIIINVINLNIQIILDTDLAVLQRGCFSYFKYGGVCVSEPVGLLSGLIQRPVVLVYHFFAVAFHAIKIEAISNGWAGAHHSFIMLFTVLYAACVTILPYLWSETKY